MEAILLILLLFCQEIYALLLLGYVINKTRKKKHIDKISMVINGIVLAILILIKYLILNGNFTIVEKYHEEAAQWGAALANMGVALANLGAIAVITFLSQVLFWIIYFKRT